MDHDINRIAVAFQIWGGLVEAVPYGTGHINDTYAASFDQGGARVRYIIQRINHNVFKEIPRMMDNIERVTRHLRAKLIDEGISEITRRTMTLIPTRDAKSYFQDEDENYWRAYVFIERATTYDTLAAPSQAFEAASAFGAFQRRLADLPEPPLEETIPGFHDGLGRFEAFSAALKADVKNRAAACRAEIDFLHEQASIFDVAPRLVAEGRIPVRAGHNDTKINNVLIDDETNEGICVIDMDTLMPGLSLYDFGDMVRTCTCFAAEDEKDLAQIVMQIPMFEKLVEGYISAAGSILNKTETDHLAFSGKMITLTIGTRFLTDFLAGDVYFKVHREGHNLDRCRTQFKLVQSIIEQEEAMTAFVERTVRNSS